QQDPSPQPALPPTALDTIEHTLKELDPDSLSPREAHNVLYQLKTLLEGHPTANTPHDKSAAS
ncbi:MAG: hypothetical protein M3Z59_06210, partial [Bombella apis]|nr:hypothetical protein [Bombella apis]